MRQSIVEKARTGAMPAPGVSGRMLLQIISPGEGSSGFYPAATLEAAARARVFKRGTQQYLDHPSESEAFDRPERSVRDLVGVLAEDARWTGSALVAECEVFATWRDRMVELAPHVGVSIRATASVEPRPGGTPQVTQIVSAESIDYVTKAGRGGRVLQVLESAADRSGGAPPSLAPEVEDELVRAGAFGRQPAAWATEAARRTRGMTASEAMDVVLAHTFGRENDPVRLAEAQRVLDAEQARNR